MKFSTLTPLLSGAVAAAAAIEKTPAAEAFGLMSLASASPVHFGDFSAALSSVFIGLPEQNATCSGDSGDRAVFTLKEGGLYLYNGGEGEEQRLYADRSGMGQGKFGYITGDQSPPRNAELTGFAIDENDFLTLNGADFIACPGSIEGSWSVWVDAGVENPAGYQGCLGFTAMKVALEEPAGCEYTQ